MLGFKGESGSLAMLESYTAMLGSEDLRPFLYVTQARTGLQGPLLLILWKLRASPIFFTQPLSAPRELEPTSCGLEAKASKGAQTMAKTLTEPP